MLCQTFRKQTSLPRCFMDSELLTVTLTAPAASQHATCRYLKTPVRNLHLGTTQLFFQSKEEDTQRGKITKKKWPSTLQLAAWEDEMNYAESLDEVIWICFTPSGCAGVMVGYPLDTIKVHIQTQDFRNPKYTGTWHCFRTILARESVAGLYRGMSSPMAGVAFVNAIVFGVYGNTQRQLSEPDALYSHFVAGAAAGIAQSPICSPMELAKTRLQLQSSTGMQFTGPVQCLRYIYRNEGFGGVFKGLGVTFLREAPGYGIYFLTYEALTRTNSSAPISTFQMLMAGGLAGTASWIFTYPIDVIKSRLQAEVSGRYSGALDCLRQSISAEGYACLFRGLTSTIIRAFPTNAATFTVVTWSFRLLGNPSIDTSEVKTQPAIVYKEPPRIPKPESGRLAQWQTAVANILTDAHQSRSYSTLSAVGFDSTSGLSSTLSLGRDQPEPKKISEMDPDVETIEDKTSDVKVKDEHDEMTSGNKDEPHVASIVNGVSELLLVVDPSSIAFGEL